MSRKIIYTQLIISSFCNDYKLREYNFSRNAATRVLSTNFMTLINGKSKSAVLSNNTFFVEPFTSDLYISR